MWKEMFGSYIIAHNLYKLLMFLKKFFYRKTIASYRNILYRRGTTEKAIEFYRTL